MIVGLLTIGIGVLWFILSVALTVWWRNHWRYIYFGGPGARLQDWVTDFVIASIAAGALCGILYAPLDWLNKHNLSYLPDILVVIGVVVWFTKKRKKENESSENVQAVQMNGMLKLCSKCGNELAADEMFCTKCGTKYEVPVISNTGNDTAPQTFMQNSRLCSNCGNELAADEMFCTKCGTKYEVPDISNQGNDTEALASMQNSKRCSNCGNELGADEMFCTKCGTKYER